MFDNIKKRIQEKAGPIYNNKRLQLVLTLICLILIIYFAVTARTGDLQYLKDQTSNKWIPLDLDSYYFLRIAETMEANGGSLPAVDTMRYYTLNLGWAPEFLPRAVYLLHKFFYSNNSMAYADIWYPIIFFVGSLLLFFILVYTITKSKLLSILGVLIFAFIPPYVYHTILGSTDHESLGIFSFLLMMTAFVAAIRLFDKKKDEEIKWWQFFGYVIWFAFTGSFVIACWNGIAIYMFMIIPMAYLGIWIIKSQDIEKKNLKLALFYLIGFVLIFLFVPIWGDFSTLTELKRYSFEPQGLLGPFTYGFIILDLIFINYLKRNKEKEKLKKIIKFRALIVLSVIVILGLLFLQFGLNRNAFNILETVAGRMLNPFGRTRIGLTVSENQQPFFGTWITSFGKIAFWIAFLGIFFIGINMANGIIASEKRKNKEKEDKIIFIVAWLFLTTAILFTRYSPSGIFNGDNLISIAVFFFGFVLFLTVCLGLYISSKIEIKNEIILIASWIIIMLISGRGAARLFIVISPLFVLVSVLAIKELYEYTKKFKEDIAIVLIWVVLIGIIGLLLFNAYNNYNGVKAQSAGIGPAANYQWQNAMSWVRTNTPTDSHFVHWWDYGYWVQYLGQRASLTDGGHGSGYYDWLTGRYMLTGNRPDLALSFMKTNEVDYLLIDPTDIGKYTAFSSIGSDDTGKDRLSWIAVMVKNDQWTQEERNTTSFVLQGGTILDEDITYNEGDSDYILPAQSAGIGGVRITIAAETNAIQQPTGIFVYNNKQTELPIRYLYFNGQIYDFNTGIPAIIRLVPSAIQDSQGVRIDNFGAAIYISPKVAKTLFANIYLMNDPFNLYPTIQIAHTEEDYVVSALKAQGVQTDSFLYFQGLRAPLQIYKIDYPENIISRPDYFIPTKTLNEDVVLANHSLIEEIDNLKVTNDE